MIDCHPDAYGSLPELDQGRKRWQHRIAGPEETLARVEPHFDTVGITRVADITGLDTVGIPVFQAVRPMGRSLSVSQGKGLTAAAAKISAVMESIEVWHAETESLPRQYAPLADMRGYACITHDMLQAPRAPAIDTTGIFSWIEARDLLMNRTCLAPGDAANLDFSRAAVPLGLARSTTGLASGNTHDEARVSALCEVIERACQAEFMRAGPRDHAQRRLDPAILSRRYAHVGDLVESIWRAGLELDLFDMTNRFGVCAIRAVLYGSAGPHAPAYLPMTGHGAHLDPATALVRAITEAAQSRLTCISGMRDDLLPDYYAPSPTGNVARLLARGMDFVSRKRGLTHLDDSGVTSAQDAATLLARIAQHDAGPVAEITLTRPDIGVPVVKILAPNIHFLASA